MYAIEVGGVWTEFDFRRPVAIVGQEGLFAVPRQWSDEEKETRAGVFKVTEDALQPGRKLVSETLVQSFGRPWLQRVYEDRPLTDLKHEKLTSLADRRWQAETGGVLLGGIPVKTDRESSSKLTAAYIKAKEDPDYSIPNWKVADGIFVTLDAATIIQTGNDVTAHVQACFDHEAALTLSILAAQDTAELAAIDTTSGWPA